MANLNPTELRKVKIIFQALKTFKQKPSVTFTSVEQDGVKINVFRKEALDYLREKLPSLEGLDKNNLENDSFLLDYLTKKTNRGKVLEGLTESEKAELYQDLIQEETHHPEEVSMADTSKEAAAEPVGAGVGGEPASSMAGGHMPSLPSGGGGGMESGKRIFIQHPESGMTGGQGTGTAATDKFTQQNPVTAKAERLNPSPASEKTPSIKTGVPRQEIPPIFNKSFKDEPLHTTNPNIKPHPEQPKPSSGTRINFGRLKPSGPTLNMFKNVGHKAGLLFQGNIGKFATPGRIATVVSAGIGAVAGAGFGGMGMVGGGIAGGLTPSWIKSGGAGNFFKKVGNGTINAGMRISNMAGGGGIPGRGKLKGKSKKRLLLFLLGGMFVFGFFFLVTDSNKNVSPSGNIGIGASSDLLSCKFGRGGDGAGSERSYQSPLLLGYIQEASSLTGIPAPILAAVIRVETSSTLSLTDDEIKNMSAAANCPENPSDQGLGIMQMQPRWTSRQDSYDSSATENGARLIGKTADTLTRDDYCDPRKNVIMAAGFILRKLSYYGYGDASKWQPEWTSDKEVIDSLARSYHGCLRYGPVPATASCSDPGRIYSYGDDIWNSVQNCKPSGSTSLPPLPTTGSPILDKITSTANQITSSLSKGEDGNFNVRPGTSGPYMCTFLVIDSYNAAGLDQINRTNSAFVPNMRNFFNSTSGFRLAPADTDVRNLRPGDAVILELIPGSLSNTSQHVSIIKSIDPKPDGTGSITTFDANNYTTNDIISVRDFKAQKAGGVSTYTITGFGQVAASPYE